MTFISIILCSYNGEKYISEQIISILKQTFNQFELIILDDKSNDSTFQIIKEFEKKDSRVTVYLNKERLGYIKNFEKGISLATGDFIMLSDQDDVWLPHKTEELLKKIKNNSLIYCDSEFVDQNLKYLGYNMSSKKNMLSTNNPLNLALDNCVSGHALMFKKELIKHLFPFPKLIPHDWWIAYNATLNNGITYLNLPLIKYRIHSSNTLVLNKNRKTKQNKILKKQVRINAFYKKYNQNNNIKKTLYKLNNTYQNISYINKIKKLILFFNHKNELFIIKKMKNISLFFYILRQFNKLK